MQGEALFLLLKWLPLILFVLFLIFYQVNRTRLINSFLLSGLLFYGICIFADYGYHNTNSILRVFLAILFLLFVFLSIFGIYIFIGFLLFNTYQVFKKERMSLAHSLGLVLALILIAFGLFWKFVDISRLPTVLNILAIAITSLFIYQLFHFMHYILAIILCNITLARKNQDYLIVLGAGLRKGNVTPLLAGRVDRAVRFYQKQKKTGIPPKLVFSGGQGKDESRAEAEAMEEYAKKQGVQDEDILLEKRSVSTLENMKFSKELMDENFGGERYRCLYVTSNYHVLRAGVYARLAGLRIRGLGSKTAWYYLPNALLREYIAYFLLYKRWNITFSLLYLLANIFIVILLRQMAS
ncbi:membrane protein [Clostridia bacterium]|nr:membrane protein [Clostridia bacterium]